MLISRKAKREVSWILLFLCCLPLVYMLIWGEGGLLKLRTKRDELQQFQIQRLYLSERYQEHLGNIQRLKENSSEIERVARERYNFARPGDVILNLPE
jgi:cell division protein FtsB